jgi:phosphate ABC transporter permease protein PstC/phosphate ABC transporter permease subunit PstA
MIDENRKLTYLLSLQILSFVLLLFYSVGMDHTLITTIFLFAFEIGLLVRIKKGLSLFVLLWQAQLFLVAFVGIIFYPSNFLNMYPIATSLQIALASAILFIELVILFLYRFKKNGVVWILKGSTVSLIVVVLLVLFIVVNEGLPGFIENNPTKMLTTTDFDPYAQPGSSLSELNLSARIDPYDFTFQSLYSTFYMAPNSNSSFNLTISNIGALNDSYLVTYSGSSGLDINLSSQELQLDRGESGGIEVSIKSTDLGSSALNFMASDTAGIQKECTIAIIVSTNGFNFMAESTTINILNQGSSNTIVPLGIENAGKSTDSCVLRISAPSGLTPSLELPDWSYTNHSATISLDAGELLNFGFEPLQLTMVDASYHVTLTASSPSDNQTIATLNLTLVMTNSKVISAVTPGPIPLSPGNTTSWKISVYQYVNKMQLDIPVVPRGLSIEAFTNGTTEVPINNGLIISNGNGSATQIELRISATNDSLSDNSSFELVMTAPGTPVQFGILGFIAGSVITTVIALIVAVPLAIACAIFLSEYCPKTIQRVIKPIMEILAGIPSVIFGLWGALTFGPFLAGTLYPLISSTLGAVIPFFHGNTGSSGRSLMTASMVLGIMIFPIIMSLSYEAIVAVPSDLKEGSVSLGATKWQTVKRITLKKARQGILGSIILGTGRALGETMAVLMILGFTSAIPSNVFDSAGTMTSAIATSLGGAFATPQARHGLFAIALLLFIFVLILNVILILVTKEGFWHRRRNGKSILKEKMTCIKNCFSKLAPSAKTDKSTEGASNEENLFLPSNVLKRRDRIATMGLYIAATIMLIIVAYIISDIIVRGGLAFNSSYLTETQLNGGFLNAITGSLMLVGVALAVAVPLTVLAAIYVREYALPDSLLSRATYVSVSTLSSTPSIIFGAFGFIFFILYLGFGYSLLSAGLTLAFMILPLLFISNMDALRNVPDSHREASYALGVSKWDTISGVVLPASVPAIASGIFIGIGRAIGETAAVLFTAGFLIDITTSLVEPVSSMPVYIFNLYDGSAGNPVLMQKVYAAAFILIVMVIALNLIGKTISHFYQKRLFGSKGIQ